MAAITKEKLVDRFIKADEYSAATLDDKVLKKYENIAVDIYSTKQVSVGEISWMAAQKFAPGADDLLLQGGAGLGKTFLAACIARTAAENGFETVIGEYLKTPKNAMVKDIYSRLGFELTAENLRAMLCDNADGVRKTVIL